MPLPPAEPKEIVITDFEGINIERNVLVRPVTSWEDLENFDLVKPGVIRKIKGNKLLSLTPIAGSDFIVALRDYQKLASGPEVLLAVTQAGNLYTSGMQEDPIALVLIGPLYDPVEGVLSEAPLIVVLPFKENGVDVQQAVITLDSKGFPQKWDGAVITRLGVVNPTDTWTVLYEHSAIIPINAGFAANEIQYLTDDSMYGIPIIAGRQVRWSWYNPTTGHNSSLAALSQIDWIIPASALDVDSPQITRRGGIVKGIGGKSFVMAYPIALDALPDRELVTFIPPPQPGYTQIRYWATRDGQDTFYLIPKLYDNFGRVISDENGAVNISDLNYGLQYTIFHFPESRLVFDGFIPVTDDGPQFPDFADTLLANVVGSGQTGDTLNVTLTPDGITLKRAHIRIAGDTTTYAVLDVIIGAPDQLVLSPDLVTSPLANAEIRPVFTPPTSDNFLITPFNDSTEQPFDRVNDPPPKVTWGAVFQSRLFLLGLDKTSLYYSRIGDYESFPPNNVFRFDQADFDPITAILNGRQVGLVSQGADQRLVIAKGTSTWQISGTSILDFAVTGVFAETGVVHKRAAITIGGFTLAQTRQGIEVLQDQVPIFVGTVIKDLIDRAITQEYGPCFALDRTNEQILLGLDFVDIGDEPQAGITSIVTMRTPRGTGRGGALSPFARITTLPGGPLSVIQECGFGRDARMVCTGFDGNIYQLFTGGLNLLANGDTEPVMAIATTQKLPQENRGLRKLFRRIRFDGNEVNRDAGWRISYKIDNGDFTERQIMYHETLIGLYGKEITIKIYHVTEAEETNLPQLSNLYLEYSLAGEAR